MAIWAPVVAALGASLLTGVFTWGVNWRDRRHRARTADRDEKSAAYHQFISRSLSFSIRAQALHTILRARTSLTNRTDVDVALRIPQPLDMMQLHDWLAEDFAPINDAWSKIQMIGSHEVVEVSTQLLDACADLVGVAIAPNAAEQQEALPAIVKRVIHNREAFIKVTRKEVDENT